MKPRLPSGLRLLLLATLLLPACVSREATRSVAIEGRSARLHVVADGSSATLEGHLDRIEEKLRELCRLLDRDAGPLGEVVARGTDEPFEIRRPELFAALVRAREYAVRTGGAYDAASRVLDEAYEEARRTRSLPNPSELERLRQYVGVEAFRTFPEAEAVRIAQEGVRLDLGPLVDGLAMEGASRMLATIGVRRAELWLANVAYVWSPPRFVEVEPFVVALSDGEELPSVGLLLRGKAVALERADPDRIDPRTGRLAGGDVELALVVADRAGEAAVLARALTVVDSREAVEILAGFPGAEAILIVARDDRRGMLASGSLRGILTLEAPGDRPVELEPRYVLPPLKDDDRS